MIIESVIGEQWAGGLSSQISQGPWKWGVSCLSTRPHLGRGNISVCYEEKERREEFLMLASWKLVEGGTYAGEIAELFASGCSLGKTQLSDDVWRNSVASGNMQIAVRKLGSLYHFGDGGWTGCAFAPSDQCQTDAKIKPRSATSHRLATIIVRKRNYQFVIRFIGFHLNLLGYRNYSKS